MAVTININMSIRCSQILYCVYISVDQKLCSKGYSRHSYSTSCCRNCSAGCQVTCCTAALCTVAICSQCKVAKVFSLTGRTVWGCLAVRCIFWFIAVRVSLIEICIVLFVCIFIIRIPWIFRSILRSFSLRRILTVRRVFLIGICIFFIIIRTLFCILFLCRCCLCFGLCLRCLLYTSPSPRD